MPNSKTIRLEVITSTMGTRTATFRGRDAEKTAAYFTALWLREGHVVLW